MVDPRAIGYALFMIGIQHIEDWRGQAVVDRDGETLGKLDEIYYAPGTDRAVLISVKSGLLGRKASLVPLHGATAGRDHLQVAHDKATIEGTSEIHRGDTPSLDELAALGDAYGIRLASDEPLQSASDLEARRAEAEAARQRADEAAREEQARRAESEDAAERARQAAAEAAAADRSAREAHDAAAEARLEAERRQEP